MTHPWVFFYSNRRQRYLHYLVIVFPHYYVNPMRVGILSALLTVLPQYLVYRRCLVNIG
jgi:hypothetical protein